MICKVVSVEDDNEIAELLSVVLRSPRIEFHTADNGQEGLDLVRATRPHLLILDVMIPGEMNGWDVYDAVRADEGLKHTPIIMLSVLNERNDRRRAFIGSAIDLYLTKPFDTLQLRREIERLVGQPGLWQPPEPGVARLFNGPIPPRSTLVPPPEIKPAPPAESTPAGDAAAAPESAAPAASVTLIAPAAPPAESNPAGDAVAAPESAAPTASVTPAAPAAPPAESNPAGDAVAAPESVAPAAPTVLYPPSPAQENHEPTTRSSA